MFLRLQQFFVVMSLLRHLDFDTIEGRGSQVSWQLDRVMRVSGQTEDGATEASGPRTGVSRVPDVIWFFFCSFR